MVKERKKEEEGENPGLNLNLWTNDSGEWVTKSCKHSADLVICCIC